MEDKHTRNRARGVVENFFGKMDCRCVPEFSRATLRMQDGSLAQARKPQPVGDETTFRAMPATFEFIYLGTCPICLTASPSSREHVPQHSISGNVLTLTCERCSNEFGSKFDPHLQRWYQNSIGKVEISGAAVDMHRFTGEYLVRENTAGGFIPFRHGSRDPAVDQILQNGGSFEMTYPQADTTRTHVAAVKTAYLAACVTMRVVPTSPRAKALRADLPAARDAPRSQRLKLSPLMKSIRVARSASEPAPGELVLMVERGTEQRGSV